MTATQDEHVKQIKANQRESVFQALLLASIDKESKLYDPTIASIQRQIEDLQKGQRAWLEDKINAHIAFIEKQ